MQRKLPFFVLMLFPVVGTCQDHRSLDTVIRLAHERAYRSEFVQWEEVTSKADSIAISKGEDAAIRFVLAALGDRHSSYRPPQPPAAPTATETAGSARTRLSQQREAVEGVPVIEVAGWSGSLPEGTAAAATLRSQVIDSLASSGCGVVLDFSSNHGGNMWPMLAGLEPLLTEGVLGYFQDAHGTNKTIEKRGGTFLVNGSAQPFVGTELRPKNAAAHIAVVVGPKSASSGEIVPIMLHGQSNVVLFGRPTSGHSTSNSTFRLPNGGFKHHYRYNLGSQQGRVRRCRHSRSLERSAHRRCSPVDRIRVSPKVSPNNSSKPTPLRGAA